MMGFAKKLDGKTDSHSVRGKRSLSETRKLIDALDYLNGSHRGEVWASGDDWFRPFKESFSEYLEWLLTSESY